MTLTRDAILERLDTFIHQRPGFEWANYGDRRAYWNDYRVCNLHLQDARLMLRHVEWRLGITAEHMAEALRDGRRLSMSSDGTLDYCTGQYFPMEYRAAVCRVLASLLWQAVREAYPHYDGDGIRKHFRREFGRGMQQRWFS